MSKQVMGVKPNRRDPICCRKCGVELSIAEFHSGGLINVEHTPAVDTGQLCFVCQRLEEEKAGLHTMEDDY